MLVQDILQLSKIIVSLTEMINYIYHCYIATYIYYTIMILTCYILVILLLRLILYINLLVLPLATAVRILTTDIWIIHSFFARQLNVIFKTKHIFQFI
jgi:hypothetical protein